MIVSLKKAQMQDCEQIHKMQTIAFKPLLDKYQDYDTNPGAEPLERIQKRMEQCFTTHYFIQLQLEIIGQIRIDQLDETTYRIAQMFVLPEFQGKGYAQQAILQVEALYPHEVRWELDTIKQESKLRYLYEKMGYKLTGSEQTIKAGMDIVYYAK
jgi:GNAT superfamily N-acetyltransferase